MSRTFTLSDTDAMTALARRIAPLLSGGDVLLLEGSIGAGKTTFARALIQARLGRAEDVPSPTYTLVQTYEADVPIWHADLYRLSSPDEAIELGLDVAFETAICLVEWPDRLDNLAPPNAAQLAFEAGDDSHRLTIDGPPDWIAALAE